MDTSASDDGDPAATASFYRISLISFFLLVACLCIRLEPGKPVLMAATAIKAPDKKPVPPPPVAAAKKKKKIYLTFDDGPNRGTQNVLDIVQQENIPATFFIVGEHVFASLEQAKTWDSLQQARNIELCNHSYTHAHNRYERFYEHPGGVVRDMEMTREKLLPENAIVRAPGRNSWRIDSLHYTDIKKSKAAMDSLQRAGFVVVGWDLEWHYDPQTMTVKSSADEMLNQVDSVFASGKTKCTDHLILLAHDQVYQKAGDSVQLRQFVQKLKQKDEYELSLVSTYPGVKPLYDTLKKVAACQ